MTRATVEGWIRSDQEGIARAQERIDGIRNRILEHVQDHMREIVSEAIDTICRERDLINSYQASIDMEKDMLKGGADE